MRRLTTLAVAVSLLALSVGPANAAPAPLVQVQIFIPAGVVPADGGLDFVAATSSTSGTVMIDDCWPAREYPKETVVINDGGSYRGRVEVVVWIPRDAGGPLHMEHWYAKDMVLNGSCFELDEAMGVFQEYHRYSGFARAARSADNPLG